MPSLPRPVAAALLALAVRIAAAVGGGSRDSTPQDQASVEIASFEHGVAVWDPHVLNDRRRKLHPGIPCSSSAQPPEHCPGGVLCPPSGHCPAPPSGQNSRLDVKHWTTAAPVCTAPAAACSGGLLRLCDSAKRTSVGNCLDCASRNQRALIAAGCDGAAVNAWCSPPQLQQPLNSTTGLCFIDGITSERVCDNANTFRCEPGCGLCNLTLVLTTPQLNNASTQGHPSCPSIAASEPGWRQCKVPSYDWSSYDAMTVKWDGGTEQEMPPSRFLQLAIEVGIGRLDPSTGLPAPDTVYSVVFSQASHFSRGADTMSLAYAALDQKLPNRSRVVALKFVVWPFNAPNYLPAMQTTRIFSIKLIKSFWPANPDYPSQQSLTIASRGDTTSSEQEIRATSTFLGTVYYDNDGRDSPSGFLDETMTGLFGKKGVYRVWASGGTPTAPGTATDNVFYSEHKTLPMLSTYGEELPPARCSMQSNTLVAADAPFGYGGDPSVIRAPLAAGAGEATGEEGRQQQSLAVQINNTQLVMFFSGNQVGVRPPGLKQIYRAVSADGIAWIAQPDRAVVGSSGNAARGATVNGSYGSGSPSVVLINGTLHLWCLLRVRSTHTCTLSKPELTVICHIFEQQKSVYGPEQVLQ